MAKKQVHVESAASGADGGSTTWKPTPEAKKKAGTYRLIALILWLVAIGGEAFTIFWVLQQDYINMVLLIVMIVVIAIFAIVGSQFWKKSNQLDPASKKDTIRFFVQNQLGAIISIIAFLPLVILILTNKNMDSKQKTIAGIIGIVALLGSTAASVDWSPPSVEEMDQETKVAIAYTGQDLVYWVKAGKVYHLCDTAEAVNRESQDGTIYHGSVATAHAAGKIRLSKVGFSECGLTEGQPKFGDLPSGIDTPTPEASETPEPTSSPT